MSEMQEWVDEYFNKYYAGKSGWQNGTAEFHDLIKEHVKLPGKVLELGPGPTNQTTQFMSETGWQVEGLDVDKESLTNEYLSQVHFYDGKSFPLSDGEYDAVVADYVMEHVEHSEIVLKETARVLKKGGVFIFRTPNLYHYVALISASTSHSFHKRVANPARGRSTKDHDPWPTIYKFNTRKSVRNIAQDAGLEEVVLRMIEKEPSYLQFSRLSYLAGVAIERMVNSSNIFSGIRSNLFGVYRKP